MSEPWGATSVILKLQSWEMISKYLELLKIVSYEQADFKQCIGMEILKTLEDPFIHLLNHAFVHEFLSQTINKYNSKMLVIGKAAWNTDTAVGKNNLSNNC